MPWIYHKNKIIFCCCFYCQYIHFWDMMHSFFWWRVWNSVFSLSKSIWKTLGTQAWEVSQCSLYLLDILLLKKINVSSAFKQALLLCKTWGILFILIENNEASNIDPCDYKKTGMFAWYDFNLNCCIKKLATFYLI